MRELVMGPSSWLNKLEVIEAELQKLVQHGLDGLRVFYTSSAIGSPYWRRGGDQCGCTLARQILTVRCQRSWQMTRSRVGSTGCYS